MSLFPTVPAASSSRLVPSERRRGWRRAVQVVAWGLVALWSLLLFAWLTLHWGILNHIERWRPEIEQRAGAALGRQVSIGHVASRSGGWVPAFELRDVVVHDASGRPALRLPKVSAALSPRSLLALEPRLEQLLIDGAELDVRRDAAGRLFVAGLPIATGEPSRSSGPSPLADWLVAQHELAVRGATVRWIDETRPGPALELSDMQFVLRNRRLRHDVRLDATPPPQWGDRFSLRGRFTHTLLARAGDWSRWSGQLQAELPRADVATLHRHVDLPLQIAGGRGALRAWIEWRQGAARQLTLDLALRDVALRASPALAPLAFDEIEGRAVAARVAEGVRLELRDFGFATPDGRRWPRGSGELSWRQAAAGAPVTGGRLQLARLDLALLAGLGEGVPLPEAWRARLAELAPEGVAHDLDARWEGAPEVPRSWQVQTRIAGLALAPGRLEQPRRPARPGVRGLDVTLQATEQGGEATLAMRAGVLEVPGVFADPQVPLDEFDATLRWTTPRPTDAQAGAGLPRALVLDVAEARFANADAAGRFSGRWEGGGAPVDGRVPRRLTLDGALERGSAERVARYLPLGLGEAPRRYVQQAVATGQIRQAGFHFAGDLWDFPFRDDRHGRFDVEAQVEGVRLHYVPGERGRPSPWPAFESVAGTLGFDAQGMTIRAAGASVGGYTLEGVQGGIRSFRNPMLELAGRGRGPATEALAYVRHSPLGGWVGPTLTGLDASGAADLELALEVPLDDVDATRVRGGVTLAGNDVVLRPDLPPLRAATGQVSFDRHGFRVADGRAQVLGGEARFDGGTQADGSLRFQADGQASVDALRRAVDLGSAAGPAAAFDGRANYRLDLAFVNGRPQYTVTSDLAGVSIALPAPFDKPSAAAWPLTVRYASGGAGGGSGSGTGSGSGSGTGSGGGAAGSSAERYEVTLAQRAQAHLEFDATTGSARLLRGGVGLGEAAPQPTRGLQVRATLGQLDLDAWRQTAARWTATARSAVPAARASTAPSAEGPRHAPGATAAVAAAAVAGATGTVGATGAAGRTGATGTAAAGADAMPWPDRIGLRAAALQLGGRRYTAVAADASRSDGLWRARVSADQAEGELEWRPADGSGEGGLRARLARLVLPAVDPGQDAAATEGLPDEPPSSLPALDIVVQQLELRGRSLGRLEIDAVNQLTDGARLWRLNRLSMQVPEATLSAHGQWQPPSAGSRAQMSFALEVADSGRLLERFGLAGALKGGKGSLTGEVGWQGSPLVPDFPRMDGHMQLQMEQGQFLKADPGVARLLGVLSLQALPRRLSLDFRDLFQEGFAFDHVAGNVTLGGGIARTNNLRMRGVQAAVLMEGEADIVRETQDLRVVVVPEINAGTASLAYAVINPAVGLGTFLAQMFLRRPIIEAGTREFRVSGGWTDPRVERVDRRAGAADAALDPTTQPRAEADRPSGNPSR